MVSIAGTTTGGFIPPRIQTNAPDIQNNGAPSSTQIDNRQAAKGASAQNGPSSEQLTPEEREQVRELQARDREVRAHEQAHKTVGGPYASPPTFETVRGPDGRPYAVSGEVKIDASAEDDPEDTIRKMEIVIRAALAPAEPSPQDQQVAQQARQQLIQARAEIRQQENENSPAQNSQRTPLEQIQEQRTQSDNQTPIEQALARFRDAEQAGQQQQNTPLQSSDSRSGANQDEINISQQAQEVISALSIAV